MFSFPGVWGLTKLGSCFHHKHTPSGFILEPFWLLSVQNPLKNEIPAAFFYCCLWTNLPQNFQIKHNQGVCRALDSWYPKIGRRCAGRSTSGVLFPRDHAHFLSHKWQRERQEATETHSGMKTPASSSGKYARLFCCLFFALHKRNTLCGGLSLEWLCHHH